MRCNCKGCCREEDRPEQQGNSGAAISPKECRVYLLLRQPRFLRPSVADKILKAIREKEQEEN